MSEQGRKVYEGRVVDVVVEDHDGHEVEVVEHPDAVAIVAVERDDLLVLVRQRRAPARREVVELPAGKLESGEDPLATARRELREETGLHGGHWTPGPVFWTTPGFCRERMYLFFAAGLERGPADPDEGEDVEVVRWAISELPSRLAEIEDAKTLVGLLLFLRKDRGSAGAPLTHHPSSS